MAMKPENLAKLDGLPLAIGSVGVVTLLTLWVAVATPDWIQGAAASSKVLPARHPQEGT